ncbi:MAG: iron ABC transporter [Saprospiraceae bacterium]|nr:MAG: iron ABC transporter [Saprospiraceae bacterium]
MPSQTELLFDLGLHEEVVGITKFCIHPREQYQRKTRIGGTKQVNLDKIRALKPDLIIANKEENSKDQILDLAREFPLWISDIITFEAAMEMIQSLGNMLNREIQAKDLISRISTAFGQLPHIANPPSVAYFIWRKPWMVAAKGTFIHTLLEYAGFSNYFAHLERYPEIALTTLKDDQPDFIFLSSEPYPFQEKHLDVLSADYPASKVVLVDGEFFSWYGSRLLHAAAYFRNLRDKLTVNS